MPLPITRGEKNPNRRGWQNERYDLSDLTAFNSDDLNVGMMLGHVVGPGDKVLTDRFIDADLDRMEAVRAAPFYLPHTGMVWGRASKPRSHYGYRLSTVEGAKSRKYNDPTVTSRMSSTGQKAMLCELRFTGQTLAPGSLNSENKPPEEVRWEPDGDSPPDLVAFEALDLAMAHVASAALLALHWSAGIRHLASLPLAGMLCRGGMLLDNAELFVRALCAAALEDAAATENRVAAVRDTYAKANAGQPFSAAPTLEDFIDPKIVATLRKWLLLTRAATGGDIGPDGFLLSDIGNAERFAAKYEEQVLYCDDQREWYLFDGQRWRIDQTNHIYVLAKQLVNDFRTRAANRSAPNSGNTTPDQWDKHAQRFQDMKQIRSMLELAKGLLPVLVEEFDADPRLLNCLNGTIVLSPDGTHTVRAWRSQDRLTKQWRANYIPDAAHPAVQWYRDTFVPEDDRWAFIEEAVGYSLTGGPKRFSFQLLGPSHAGKSMLLRILKEHAGEYGAALKYQALIPDRHGGGDKPRSDLVGLRGARILTISEVGEGAVWDNDLFKTMTGTDFYAARGAYEKRGQTFQFTCSIWTSGNKPYGGDADQDAIYERVRVVKFEHPMGEEVRDDKAEDAMVDADETGDAWLACWLRGYTRAFRDHHGIPVPPDSVRQATQEVRSELDPFERILRRLVEFTRDPADGVLKSELNSWAKMVSTEELGWRKWGYKEDQKLESAMERRGCVVVESSARFAHRKHWLGVRWLGEISNGHKVTLPDWLGE